MGSKSKSKQTNQQIDRRIGATDEAIVATEGSSVSVQDISPEVVEAALGESFDFAHAEGEGARMLAEQALKIVQEGQRQVRDVTAGAAELVDLALSKTPGTNTSRDILLAGAAVAAVWAFSRR
jgi:hypothetical protein